MGYKRQKVGISSKENRRVIFFEMKHSIYGHLYVHIAFFFYCFAVLIYYTDSFQLLLYNCESQCLFYVCKKFMFAVQTVISCALCWISRIVKSFYRCSAKLFFNILCRLLKI